jgi:antitoxin component YwqK of YwqJK toxin-antitoxin module
MYLKITINVFLMAISLISVGQTETDINKTDQQGRKQGHWIKKYQDKNIMYDGFFKDNHPVGEFKRYNEDKSLKSLLIYSDDGNEAVATIYHSNGFIASKGKYINQKKEGKWQFFSAATEGYLISEENYSGNFRNGTSFKYYPDGTMAEGVNYVNDVRQGEWVQYYPNGIPCLKSSYLNGSVNGKFEVWFDNGKIEFSGQYKNDVRDGPWLFYNNDGTFKYEIKYKDGYTNDRRLADEESEFINLLEKNKGRIADPEKTGVIK